MSFPAAVAFVADLAPLASIAAPISPRPAHDPLDALRALVFLGGSPSAARDSARGPGARCTRGGERGTR